MDDDRTKAQLALLETALPNIAFDGWNMHVLRQAAEKLGKDKREADRLFPDGAIEAISTHSRLADAAMLRALQQDYSLESMKIRERIATAVMVRLRQHNPNREAIRRALGVLMLPWNSRIALNSLYDTVDAMWRAAGDTSTDYNFYTKRLLLAKVYMTTLYVWLNDDSENLQETEAFLYRRIEDVMKIEKAKHKAKEKLKGFEGLSFAQFFSAQPKA